MEEILSFGAWLKQRRRVLDLTQQEVAQRALCSLSTLRKIETGDLLPSKDLARLLAIALDVPTDEQEAFVAFARDERRTALTPAFVPPPPPTVALPPTTALPTVATAPLPKAPRHHLPTQLTPFIGRDVEVAAVQQMLANPACALLTIVGPGGIGKTRLALAVAHTEIPNLTFVDGVYFVSFAGVAAPDFMLSTIANAIGFTFAGVGDPQTQLFNYLSARTMLLVLDNLEHLLAGVELFVDLLQAAPTVKLLITSRERLAIEGEWVFDLPALVTPALAQSKTETPAIADLHHYPAVALFVERAQRTHHSFTLSAQNSADVAQICRLVGGMPLALELAAGWVHALSCAEIAGEVARNLDFLAITRRDLPARQRSVRATFDHSWQLLNPAEQQALRRLAVFRGGFQREAAATVAGATLPLLAGLVTKSLVQRTAEGRYDLHELVRQYAADHLHRDPQEETHTRHAHADYFLGVLDDRTGLFNHQHAATRKALLRDSENLRVAWHWAAESGRYDLLQGAAATFWYFHELCFLLHEGEALFAQALQTVSRHTHADAPTTGQQQGVQGELQARQGWFQSRIGHLTTAQPLLEQAMHTLRRQTNQAALADLLHHFSTLERYHGSFEHGQAYAREALALNRVLDRPWWTAMSLHVLGNNTGVQGMYAEALGYYTEALTILRKLGEPRATATLLVSLSQMTRSLGQVAETKALLQEALALATQLEDTATVAFLYEQMGLTAARAQEYAEAQQFLQRAITLFNERSDAWHCAFALNWSGWIYVESAEDAHAQARFVDALRLSNEANFIPNAICSLVGLATVSAREIATEVMLAIAHYALDHPASTHETKAYAEQLRTLVEKQLAPTQIETARTLAQQATLASLTTALTKPVLPA